MYQLNVYNYINIFFLGPNVSDILNEAKLVKPLIEKPYIAAEVSKISDTESKPKYNINQMTSATIVGHTDSNTKEEKPTIYSTVIRRKPTSVTRPIPVTNVRLPQVNIQQNVLPQGSFSVPVKIESNIITDPTMKDYVQPEIRITKKIDIENVVISDIKEIQKGMTEGDKVSALMKMKERLIDEQKKISLDIKKDGDEIVKIEKIGNKMKNVLEELKMKMNIKH